jgi:hypothetical protein
VAGSWAGAAEQWQDSGGVAGVAARRGGEVVPAVEAQDADGQGLHRLAMPQGVLPGALGGVLGEGDVAEVVQRLDVPVAAPAVRKGAGWAWAVRLVTADTVTVRHRWPPSGRTRRVMRIAWAA